MNDLLVSENKRELNILKTALREGIVKELRDFGEVRGAICVSKLTDDYAMERDYSTWVVKTWFFAITGNDIKLSTIDNLQNSNNAEKNQYQTKSNLNKTGNTGEHQIVNGICVLCGSSSTAIAHFGWRICDVNGEIRQNTLKEIDDLLKSLNKHPHEAYTAFLIGLKYAELKIDTKAIEYYKKTLDIESNYYEAYWNMAAIYNNNYGNTEEAIKLIQKAIEINPNDAELLYSSSIIYSNTPYKAIEIEMKTRAAKLGHQEAQKWLLKNKKSW